MDGKKTILIVEDHTIVREGLKALLEMDPDLEVTGEAEDGHQAVKQALKLEPDLILMDLAMPRMHGLQAVREISKRSRHSRILVLTVHKDEEYILASFKAGAQGYVLKDATHAELKMAIRTVLSGKRYATPDISDLIIEGFVEGRRQELPASAWESLTPREQEILKLVAEGNRNRQIADLLCISPKTVERHRANLMKKLNVHNATALTAMAIDKGLVSI